MELPSSSEDVVAVDVPWRPTDRSGRPVLFQSGDRAVLVFDIGSPPRTEGMLTAVRRSIVPSPESAQNRTPARAEIRFEDCEVVSFGYPSAGDRPGHPLYQRGLGSPGLFEVANSNWTNLLAGQHGVAHPGETWPSYPLRHLIAAFNEATFECLCGSILGRATDLSVPEILEGLMG